MEFLQAGNNYSSEASIHWLPPVLVKSEVVPKDCQTQKAELAGSGNGGTCH